MESIARFLFGILPLSWLLIGWSAADEIEFLNGSKLSGNVVAIHKKERQVEFKATVAGKEQVAKYPYAKIHRVLWKGKNYVVNKKPATAPATVAGKRVTRTQSEVKKLIADVGGTDPEWLKDTPLDFPKSLDLNWPKPAPKGWNNQKNVGQYIWDRINPNAGKWRSGIKLMDHMLQMHENNRQNEELRQRIMASLGAMYFRFFQDYARAAYWWQKAGQMDEIPNEVGLAECYWRLGSAQMARSHLKDLPLSLAKIKLLGDMGETKEALGYAKRVRMAQPHELYLLAGDICRMEGDFEEAIEWFEKVLSAPDARNEAYSERYRGRAQNSIDAIRKFELLDLSKLKDGTYAGTAIGYEGPIEVEATVTGGRISKVEITQHKEKQYYSALRDIPEQIIRKQSLKDIEATSRATITAVAIINATAEALSDEPQK